MAFGRAARRFMKRAADKAGQAGSPVNDVRPQDVYRQQAQAQQAKRESQGKSGGFLGKAQGARQKMPAQMDQRGNAYPRPAKPTAPQETQLMQAQQTAPTPDQMQQMQARKAQAQLGNMIGGGIQEPTTGNTGIGGGGLPQNLPQQVGGGVAGNIAAMAQQNQMKRQRRRAQSRPQDVARGGLTAQESANSQIMEGQTKNALPPEMLAPPLQTGGSPLANAYGQMQAQRAMQATQPQLPPQAQQMAQQMQPGLLAQANQFRNQMPQQQNMQNQAVQANIDNYGGSINQLARSGMLGQFGGRF